MINSKHTPITYSCDVRGICDLLDMKEFIFMDSFTTAKPNPSGLVGFAELRILVATGGEKDVIKGWKDVEIVIPGCPVYRDRRGPRIELPRVEGGGPISVLDPYSKEKLQAAFRQECGVFISQNPELKPLLGPHAPGEKGAA